MPQKNVAPLTDAQTDDAHDKCHCRMRAEDNEARSRVDLIKPDDRLEQEHEKAAEQQQRRDPQSVAQDIVDFGRQPVAARLNQLHVEARSPVARGRGGRLDDDRLIEFGRCSDGGH